jgi:hypothetical protein
MIRRTEFGNRWTSTAARDDLRPGLNRQSKDTAHRTRHPKPMKPILEIRNRRDSIALVGPRSRSFPKTDFNYRATTLAKISDRGVHCCRFSFRAISRDYFAMEAPRHFAHETALFFIMMMTIALPLLNASIAILNLIRIS